MLFLGWLADQGLIDAEDVVEVLRAHIAQQKPIGRIAREQGFMTMRGVMAVLAAQADRPNARFGELAIEMGYLDRKGLIKILEVQLRLAPRYEDLVGALGILDAVTLAEARAAFNQALADEDGILRAISTPLAGAAGARPPTG